MPHVSQIDLIAAITKHLDRRGLKHISPKQFNAVIEAANLIVAAYSRPPFPASPGMGLTAWLQCDETGLSSKVMANRLSREVGGAGCYVQDYQAYPRDPSDLGRCVGLLDAAPEMRPYLGKMADVSPVWATLAAHWDELERLYREELPSGQVPKCYARMTELIEGGGSS